MAPEDLGLILGVVSASAAAGAVLGRLALHAVRGHSVGIAVAVVVATSAAVMGMGVLVIGDVMLVSGHALVVLLIVVVAAALAAAIVAFDLARRVARGGAALSDLARRVGAGDVGVGGDVTDASTRELRMLARELGDADRRLADARAQEAAVEATRRELVAWVSHDLRSPLAAILAMASALEDGVVSDTGEVAAYHGRIRRESVRLGGMIDDLFELSRITAGALALSMDRVPLVELVDEVLEGAVPVARARGVRLVAPLPGDDAAVAFGDTQQLARVLRNLVANAVRHTPHDGTVVVEASNDAAGVPMLSVTDGCGGIAPDELARVFDVGYRGEWARTPDADVGAGLGLAIARGIVEAHDGVIGVENVGTGCRFVVRLPAAAAR